MVLIAFGVLGLTIGTFTGMSESPVGSTIVAALFGLLGGGGIFAFMGGLQKKPMARARLIDASWALLILCSTCLVSVFLGISLREGTLFEKKPEAKGEQLVSLAVDSNDDVSRAMLMKLIILQTELESLGVPRSRNNETISSFLKASRRERGLDPDRVGDMRGYVRDIAQYHDNLISESFENMGEALTKERKRIEALPRAQQAAEYSNLLDEVAGRIHRAEKTSRGIGESARKLRELFILSVQPDLEIMLEVVSRYKTAQLHDTELRIATPAWRRPGAGKAYDPPRMSIKP